MSEDRKGKAKGRTLITRPSVELYKTRGVVFAAAAILAASAVYAQRPKKKNPPPSLPPAAEGKTGPAKAYPDPSKTPGLPNPDITQANLASTVCSKTWSTKSIRPEPTYTTKLKLQQLKDMGLTGSAADYEEDHFISLELGGDPRDQKNLWPEPWNLKVGTNDYGAHTKDFVESFLHDEACFSVPNHKTSSAGKYRAKSSITLARAQEIITQDWYACFQKMQVGQSCQ